MTTKGLARKQIIILININNKMQFIRESSVYIVNINRALKISNPKSLLISCSWKIQT